MTWYSRANDADAAADADVEALVSSDLNVTRPGREGFEFERRLGREPWVGDSGTVRNELDGAAVDETTDGDDEDANDADVEADDDEAVL